MLCYIAFHLQNSITQAPATDMGYHFKSLFMKPNECLQSCFQNSISANIYFSFYYTYFKVQKSVGLSFFFFFICSIWTSPTESNIWVLRSCNQNEIKSDYNISYSWLLLGSGNRLQCYTVSGLFSLKKEH